MLREWRAEPKPADVYNLTVDAAHEFFAGGVLVHNCDAVRYLLANLGGGPEFMVFDATADKEPIAEALQPLGRTMAVRLDDGPTVNWWEAEIDDEGPRPGGTVEVP